MRKQVLLKSLLIIFIFTCFQKTYASGSDGTNGTVTPLLSTNKLTVGEPVTLSVIVSGMTNGGESKSKGDCIYSISIPEELLTITESETPSPHDLTDAGESGNGTYQHGTYTAEVPASYTFEYNVSTGEKGVENIAPVVFHPETPLAKAATNIHLFGFDANWQGINYAEKYIITLTKENEEPVVIDEEITGLSHTIGNLIPGTKYTYTLKAGYNGLESINESDPIEITTDRPVLSEEGLNAFGNVVINTSDVQVITVHGTDLQDDISLQLEEGSSFSIDKTIIGKDGDKVLNITFAPTRGGQHSDYLILNSLYALEKRILLTGTAIPPAPVATAATDEKGFGFTANWKENTYAESYLLTIYDKDKNALEDYTDLNVGSVTTYDVVNLLPNTVYSYTVKAVNSGLNSGSSNEITVTTADGAVITYSQISPFSLEVNATASKTIRVKGTNLIEKINLSISGDYFSIDVNELDAEGGSVVVTYAPTAVGAHEATLTLSSATAQDVIITLKGAGIPSPTTTLPATDLALNSFTANWNPALNASDYLLTVKQDGVTIIEDQSSEGAISFIVSELTSGKTYTYSVKVVENGQISVASDITSTYTHAAPTLSIYPEKTAVRVKWSALPGVTNYEVNLFEGDEIVAGYSGIIISENEYLFTGLNMNTLYSVEIISVYGDERYSSGKTDARTNSDSGAQLRNPGFELWDGTGTSIEPANWSSFMTGKIFALGESFARKQKVKESSNVRPGSTGKKSAFIFSDEPISGTIANGNLTTGQIQANSTTANDPSNHNKTIISDDNFNAPFTGRPDSLTVWVKYIPKTATDEARIAAAIHDNYEYRDPSASDPQADLHVIAKAQLNYAAAANNDWQRIAIPFKYEVNSLKPAYMLLSFTTNKTPGKGSANDSVFIDDILMVYNPTLTIGQPDKLKYVLGESITVPFTITGTMSPSNLNAAPNIVYMELSDKDGLFDENSRRIAQLTTDNSGTITANLPDDIELSSSYRVRIVTTNYPMTSEVSNTFVVREMPAAPVAIEATDVTAASFTANWEPVNGATGYLVLINGREITLEGGESTSCEVKNLSPETSYSYTVKAVADDLVSEPSNSISVTTASGGTITYTGETSFNTNANVAAVSILNIEGQGLIGDISVDFADNESGFFSIDKNEISLEGGELEVTYYPTSIGIHSAQLIFRSSFVNNVIVDLSGKALPVATTTTTPDDRTPVSFTAKWEATTEAEKYLLTILDNDMLPISGYIDIDTDNETAYTVTGLSPETAYNYTVKVVANGLESAVSNATSVSTLKKPQIDDAITVKKFLLNNNTTDTETITIVATDLFENKVTVAINGDYFSIDKPEVEPGEQVTITYSPVVVAKHTATLTLSSEYADNVVVDIEGTSRPIAPLALKATNTSFTSITANWEEVSAADAYLLTLKDNSGNIVSDYDQKNVGTATSIQIDGLTRLRNYYYSVETLQNDIVSLPSNVIEARTTITTDIHQLEKNKISLYPNPAKYDMFITGVIDGQEYTIIDIRGIVIQKGKINGNKISVDKLMPGMYILKMNEITSSFIKE